MNSSADSGSLHLSCCELQLKIGKQTQNAAQVFSIGSEVAEISGRKGRQNGRVLAIFDRSFYVQFDQDVFCIGVASLGRGPLHVLLDSDQDRLPWQISHGLTIELDYTWAPLLDIRAADLDDVTAIEDRALYSGKVSGGDQSPASIRKTRLVLELIHPPKQTGFCWILGVTDWQNEHASLHFSNHGYSAIDRSLYTQCIAALQCLLGWLQISLKPTAQAGLKDSTRSVINKQGNIEPERVSKAVPPTRVIDLLGAGPGLTPAGDDLLAGVLLVLHRIRRAHLAESLWQVLKPHLLFRTNVISAAHLRLAAQGQCSEPMLQMLDSVLDSTRHSEDSDSLQVIASDVQAQANRIGASSGWDTLAGMSLVLLTLP